MSWRFRVETEGAETRIAGRDADGRRHDAVLRAGEPPRVTLLGAGPHHPCRMAEAVGVGECLVALGPETARGEIAARRRLPVGAPLDWRSRLQAAAELDRLSGIVFDELMDRGAHPGEVGLAPVLHLREPGGRAAAVWLGTEAEMRADFGEEIRRLGGGKGEPVDEPLVIEAMAITAYAPSDEAEVAPPAPPELRRFSLADGPAPGGGVLNFAGAELVIDHGWSAAAEGALLRLRRAG